MKFPVPLSSISFRQVAGQGDLSARTRLFGSHQRLSKGQCILHGFYAQEDVSVWFIYIISLMTASHHFCRIQDLSQWIFHFLLCWQDMARCWHQFEQMWSLCAIISYLVFFSLPSWAFCACHSASSLDLGYTEAFAALQCRFHDL